MYEVIESRQSLITAAFRKLPRRYTHAGDARKWIVPLRFHLSSSGFIREPDDCDQKLKANKLTQPAACFKHLSALRRGALSPGQWRNCSFLVFVNGLHYFLRERKAAQLLWECINCCFPRRAAAAKARARSRAQTKPYKAHVNALSQPCLGHLVDKRRRWKCLVCCLEGGEETFIISHLTRPEGWMKEMRKGWETRWEFWTDGVLSAGKRWESSGAGGSVEGVGAPLQGRGSTVLITAGVKSCTTALRNILNDLEPAERNVWRQHCPDYNTHNTSVLTDRKCQTCSNWCCITKAWNQLMIWRINKIYKTEAALFTFFSPNILKTEVNMLLF